jgi:hypothetical protein
MSSRLPQLKQKLLTPGKKFSIAAAKEIINEIIRCSREEPIDTRDRFHNIFFHEICPLLVIAEHVGNSESRIAFMGASAKFDGLIIIGREQLRQKVELTAAIDGRNDALVMELLRIRGHAPLFQRIQIEGTKTARTFGENEPEVQLVGEYEREELLPLLRRRISAKVKKSETNKHYVDAWLGVVFDDYVMPVGERKKEHFDPICREAVGVTPGSCAPFTRIFCVGISREYLFDSALS